MELSDEKKSEVVGVVRKYLGKIKDKSIFFFPNIPEKKLKNALDSYASAARYQKILILFDNTTFGSAKDGALVTDTAIYAHNIGEQGLYYKYDEISSVMLVPAMTSKLFINDAKFLDINFMEKLTMQQFSNMLKEIVDIAKPAAEPAGAGATESPTDALRKLKQLLDEGIITEEEYNVKKQKYLEML